MFEAVECYGWIVNNNIHGLEVVTEKKKTKLSHSLIMNLGYRLLLLSCTYVHPEKYAKSRSQQERIDHLNYK